jgi:hypothetical protein
MESLTSVAELANEHRQNQIKRERAIAAASLEAVRQLNLRERKALIARKPQRQFAPSEGHYDPQYPWSFRRNDGLLVVDEPLREFHAQLHRLDVAIKGIWTD